MSQPGTLEPPARRARWRTTVVTNTNAGGLAAATCRPGRVTELVALAEAVRDSAGSKDLFQPLQPPESANRAPLDQASDGLPAEGKKQLEEIAPPGRESAADLLKKDESNAGIRQPLPHEHVADAQWALEQWGEGAFAGATKLFVAVYQQAVIDAGDDPVELATRCAGGRGVPPDRIVIKYVGPED